MSNIRPTTYDAVIEAAFAELTENTGASLAVVAKRAGVGRATLHRHFRTRDDLVHALAKRATSELHEAADIAAKGAKSYTDALEKIMAAVIGLGDRQWFLTHEDLTKFDDIYKQNKRSKKDFHKLMQNAQKEGLFAKVCPVEWAMSSYDHLIYAGWMMVKNGHATPKQAARLAWSTFAKGIGGAAL